MGQCNHSHKFSFQVGHRYSDHSQAHNEFCSHYLDRNVASISLYHRHCSRSILVHHLSLEHTYSLGHNGSPCNAGTRGDQNNLPSTPFVRYDYNHSVLPRHCVDGRKWSSQPHSNEAYMLYSQEDCSSQGILYFHSTCTDSVLPILHSVSSNHSHRSVVYTGYSQSHQSVPDISFPHIQCRNICSSTDYSM